MRSHILICAGFLLTGLLAAQTPNNSSSTLREGTRTISATSDESRVCPVTIRAEHAADGSLLGVDGSRLAHPKGIGQGLIIVLSQPNGARIVKAVITVHGFTAKGRMMGTPAAPNHPDASRTMRIRLTPIHGDASSASVWAPGMSAVDSVDLDSVTYDNGLSRRFARGGACHVDANHFMLITKH